MSGLLYLGTLPHRSRSKMAPGRGEAEVATAKLEMESKKGSNGFVKHKNGHVKNGVNGVNGTNGKTHHAVSFCDFPFSNLMCRKEEPECHCGL